MCFSIAVLMAQHLRLSAALGAVFQVMYIALKRTLRKDRPKFKVVPSRPWTARAPSHANLFQREAISLNSAIHILILTTAFPKLPANVIILDTIRFYCGSLPGSKRNWRVIIVYKLSVIRGKFATAWECLLNLGKTLRLFLCYNNN